MCRLWFPKALTQMLCARFKLRPALWLAALWVLAVCTGCGGGNSSVTSYSGGGLGSGTPGTTVTLDPLITPAGPNTVDIVVDAGPSSFSLGSVANVPYVSVTVCPPNSGAVSAAGCVTIDHVFLDTGSYGLRLLKSSVSKLNLPALTLAADAQHATPAGTAVECYPFVLGGLWGPLARADVHMGGETATALPIQLIEPANTSLAPNADCIAAAGGKASDLFTDAASLQANGILGIGMMRYDCGLSCVLGDYAGFHVQYYVCPDAVTANCLPAAVASELQTQNPVAHFVADDGNPDNGGKADNNGSIISLPAVPSVGAAVVKGRLAFGIGTRSNNAITLAASANMLSVQADTTKADYLYFTTTLGTAPGSAVFTDSYIDSGSNAYFFNDASIAQCKGGLSGSASNNWYCPTGAVAVTRSATLTGSLGQASADFSIANADVLLGSGANAAFSNLGGTITSYNQTFVWGLPFFYGRSVYTSIWGQALSVNGPWNAF